MNFHTYTVFNTVLHNNCEAIPFVLASVSLDADMVHLQMEDIKHDIQDATSDYLDNTPIPEKNILDIDDDKIKYIKGFIHPRHSYSEPHTTQDHCTTDLRAEVCTVTAATAPAIMINVGIPTNPLSNYT